MDNQPIRPVQVVLLGALVAVQADPLSMWTPLIVVIATVLAAERVAARGGGRSALPLPAAVAVASAALPGAGLISWIETDSLRLAVQGVLPAIGLACYLLGCRSDALQYTRVSAAALVAASVLTVPLHDDSIGRIPIGQPGSPLVTLAAIVLLVTVTAARRLPPRSNPHESP